MRCTRALRAAPGSTAAVPVLWAPYAQAVNKDVQAFCRRLERAGLIVERSGGGHYRVSTPDGGTVAFVPFSPSSNRWRQNTIAQLRRRGITIE